LIASKLFPSLLEIRQSLPSALVIAQYGLLFRSGDSQRVRHELPRLDVADR
jgi:hypothetical protein